VKIKLFDLYKDGVYSFVAGRQPTLPCEAYPLTIKGAYLLYPPHFAREKVEVSDELVVKLARAINTKDRKRIIEIARQINELFEKGENKKLISQEDLPAIFKKTPSKRDRQTIESSFDLTSIKENGKSAASLFLEIETGGEKRLTEKLHEKLSPYLPESIKEPYGELLRLLRLPDPSFKRALYYLINHAEPFQAVYFGTTDDGTFSLYAIYPKNFKKKMDFKEIVEKAKLKLPKGWLEEPLKRQLWEKMVKNFKALLEATKAFHSNKGNYHSLITKLAKENTKEIEAITFAYEKGGYSVNTEAEINKVTEAVIVIKDKEDWLELKLRQKLKKAGLKPSVYRVWFFPLLEREEFTYGRRKKPAFYYLAVAFALLLAYLTKKSRKIALFRFYSDENSGEDDKNRLYDDFISFTRLAYGYGTLLPFQGYSNRLNRLLDARYAPRVVQNLLLSSIKKNKRVTLKAPVKTFFNSKGHLIKEIVGGLITPTCPGEKNPTPLSRRHRLFEIYTYQITGTGEETTVSLELIGGLIRLAGGEEVKIGQLPKVLENPIYLVADLSVPLELVEEMVLKREKKEGQSISVYTIEDFPLTHFNPSVIRRGFILFKEKSSKYASLMGRIFGDRGLKRHFYTVFPPMPPTAKVLFDEVGFATSHGDTYLLFPESSHWLEGAKTLELLFLALGVYRNDLTNSYAKEKDYLKNNRTVELARKGVKYSFPINSLLIEGIARVASILWRE